MASKSPVRLILCGSQGRMGNRVATLAQADARFSITAGVVRRSESFSIYPFPRIEEKDLLNYIAHADVLVDFSIPEASVRFAGIAAKKHRAIVIGTTGLRFAQLSRIRAAAKKTAVFLSPNFSPGMNLLFQFAERAAAALKDYDCAVLEAHHAKKKDAPSGTALRLAESVRHGHPDAEVGISSQRLGTVIGDHTLTLAGPFERIELTHRAESRDVFARGALEAACWVSGRKSGLYGMEDLLRG